MRRHVDLVLIGITLILYCFNQEYKTVIPDTAIRNFMCSYFNDVIGSITFTAYTSIVISFRKLQFRHLWQVEMLMLGCGFVWEVITPLFRKNTVGDIGDIFAYLAGGAVYFVIFKTANKARDKTS